MDIASPETAGAGVAAATGAAAGVGVGAAAATAGAETGAAIFSSTTGAGADASVADELGAVPATKSLKAATSAPSSTVTIIGTPTEISPDPGWTNSLATTPSSCASGTLQVKMSQA